MRNRRIFGSLAEFIALPPHYVGVRLRLPTWSGQRSRRDTGQPSRAFATSEATRSSPKRPAKRLESVAPLSLSEHARRILRHVPDSVVICTASAQNASLAVPGSSAVPVGLTMSSFAPLSLSPTPVITFNVAVPSRTEQAIAKGRHFMIHILSGDVQGARLADVFRKGNAHPDKTLHALHRSGGRVVWPHKTPGQHLNEEQPFLRGAGVLYVLRCKLLDKPSGGLVPVRDHVVVFGEVLEILEGEADTMDSRGAPRFGLLYGDRHYRQLSSAAVRGDSED